MTPVLTGLLDADQVSATADSVEAVQRPNGAIAWFDGGHLDPWDHVQAAMGLTVAGRVEAAEAAYMWSARAQRPDGSWATQYVGTDLDEVADDATDANFTAYLATGIWHHWQSTTDLDFVEAMWPAVAAALDAVALMQAADGTVRWTRSAGGVLAAESLVTGNASIHLSLRCGVALATLVGESRPVWERAAVQLRTALDHHEERYASKSRYSMDWYYPVLGGALSATDACKRLDARWDDFVVPEQGVRCVDDSPWVTGGETCELVLALDACDRGEEARQLFSDIQRLRASDGSYWTGYVYPDDAFWPIEQATWTAATMLLAADALSRTTSANGLFRGEDLPPLTSEEDLR